MTCDSSITNKINDGQQSGILPVLSLPAGNKDVEKFSARSGEDVEFVHTFKSNIGCSVYVKCCSGICQSRYSKKKNVSNLFTNNETCCHLATFKEYIDSNINKHPLLQSVTNSNNNSNDEEVDEIDDDG